MALIKEVRGFTPEIGEDCFIAETAVIIGDVIMGNECSVWYNAVLRGDVNSIRIGNRVNIQDGAVLHTLYQKSQIHIGNNVTVSHNVTLHGCIIEDNSLIGIGAIVLDDARVGSNSIIAAGSLVLSGQIIEPNSVYGGVPAKKIKEIDPDQSKNMIDRIANNYVMYAGWYKNRGE